MPAHPVTELVLADPDPAAAPVRFVLGIDDERRLVIGLRVAGERIIDVSRRPGLLARAAGARTAEVAATCRRVCGEHGAWIAPEDAPLAAAAGGAAFPILGAAYERSAVALEFIPRWSAPVLAAPSPGPAAQRAFGIRSTRATARALPASLGVTEGRPPNLAGLALALVGAEVLEPDEIATVLRQGADNTATITTDDVRALRRASRDWGRRVMAPLLREAATATDATARLLLAALMWAGIGRNFDRRLPHRLDDLVGELRDAMPVDPGPPADRDPARPPASGTPSVGSEPRNPRPRRRNNPGPPAAVTPIAATPVPVPAPPLPAHHVPRRAPTGGPRAPSGDVALPVDQRLAPLDGARLDRSLRLVLPRSTRELSAWGTRLANCLGGYRSAAVSGRSVIVGVEASDRLAYCIELTPTLTVRQFLGKRNHAPDPEDEAVVLAALDDARNGNRLRLR